MKSLGLEAALAEVCGIEAESPLVPLIADVYRRLLAGETFSMVIRSLQA